MIVKTIELPGGDMINIIVDKKFTFLFPITELSEIVGLPKTSYRTTNLTALTKRTGFVKDIHFIRHEQGNVACFKNLKPGTRLLTRLGMIAICTSLRTPEAKRLAEWSSRQTYKKLIEDGEVFELFKSILFTIRRISDPDIKKHLQEKIKELKKYI